MARKEREKSTHCLVLVNDFETQIYRHKTESKFAFQNQTSTMLIHGGTAAITKLRFVHYRGAIANKPDFII